MYVCPADESLGDFKKASENIEDGKGDIYVRFIEIYQSCLFQFP